MALVWNFVLVLELIQSSCYGNDVDHVTDLHLIGLFPLSGSWDGGQGLLPATQMAIDDINRRSDILPGYRLHMEYKDTQCDSGLGVKAVADHVCESTTKIMIIGAGCSTVCQAVAQVSHRWNLIQISYAALSPALSNRAVYPSFFRLVSSENDFNEARMEIFRYFKWSRVATIHQNYQIFSTMAEDMARRMKEEHFEIVAQVTFIEDPETAVRRLKARDARIIVAGFYRDKARKVFCHAYNLGFYGKQVWLTTGSLSHDATWWKEPDPSINCTRRQLEKIVQNTFVIDNDYFNPDDTEEGLTGMSVRKFREIFKKTTRNMVQPVSGADLAPAGYDTVWAAALALNKTMNSLNVAGKNATLADFSYANEEMKEIMKTKLLQVNFTSVSGRVHFDSNGDGIRSIGIQMIKGAFSRYQTHTMVSRSVKRILSHIQHLPESRALTRLSNEIALAQKIQTESTAVLCRNCRTKVQRVGRFDKSKPPHNRMQIADVWKGMVPKDGIRIKRVLDTPPVPMYITMTSLASIGIIIALTFLSFNIMYRNVRIVRLSSPNINNIILFGCILAYLSVFIEDIHGTRDSIYCKISIFLLLIAFSFSFGGLFAKTWRIHAIFTASLQMRRLKIKDRILVLMILGLVCLNCFILCIWFIVDPQTIMTNDVPDKKQTRDDVIIQHVYNCCSSSKQTYFLIAIGTIQGILLILGVFLALQTRKVKFSILNESRHIGMCIYNVVVLGVVGVLVCYTLKSNVTLLYVTLSCVTILCTTVTQCLLFVPKILLYRKFLQGKLTDSSVTSSNDQVIMSSTRSTTTSTQTDLPDTNDIGDMECMK